MRALRWRDVDLAAGVIHVRKGWDDKEGEIETKGRNRRKVPIPALLRDVLVEHRMSRRNPRPGEFVFGSRPKTSPFDPGKLTERADEAWQAASLERITLHQCRHTYASLMIASNVNARALADFMGHASIQTTFDKYGHLFPGAHDEAGALLDAYLERANTQARLVQLGS